MLGFGLVVIVSLVAGGIVLVRGWQNLRINTVGRVDFAQAMPVPPLAGSTVGADGTRTFTLSLQTGTSKFFGNAATNTWGINGAYLGPTLRAKRGEQVAVQVTNHLREVTSLHWHGMHLPPAMDGGPHQPIEVNGTWSPHWSIDQPAATLWYHPHPHGTTEKHVYRGLAGMFIVDDDSPAAAALPHMYGVDDLPVIVQDKSFTASKQLREGRAFLSSTGNLGREILVNGARTPHVDVSSQRVRLRLLNGSTARIYNFALSNNRPLTLIATDGGLLSQPVSLDRLLLTPGQRAEVIVELTPQEQVTLRSLPTDLRAGAVSNRIIGGDDALDILQLRAAPTLAASPAVPAQLADVPVLAVPATTPRSFRLADSAINGRSMDLNRMDFTVAPGSTEAWDITNRDGTPHNFHIHGVQFQVTMVNSAPPPPELSGWHDTVPVLGGQTVRLAVRLPEFADPKYPYMLHCHLLWHEDSGMMGQFLVLPPGTAPSEHRHSDEHAH